MHADPAQALRERGLQVTVQRLAVMRAVAKRPHATAEELSGAVRADLGTISKQAVYDALSALSEAGLIRRIQPAGSVARYEDRVGDNHHHAICRDCGLTVDVDCAEEHAPCLSPAGAPGFRVDEAEVIFWGRCEGCAGGRGVVQGGPGSGPDRHRERTTHGGAQQEMTDER